MIDMFYRIDYLEKTCTACPAIWEGRTDDNKYIFIRYRWGSLRALVGKTQGETYENANIFDDCDCVYLNQVGEELDGDMSTKQMEKILFKHFGF